MKKSIANISVDRRRFNAWLAAGLVTGFYPGMAQCRQKKAQTLKVAALQMAPKLGDAQANMEQAERLIRDAQKMGAQWIMLPEMFTTAAAFHPNMLTAIQPVDGDPAQLMRRLARQGNSVIGGSFLASRDGEVYNSFLLVFPDGQAVRHDKDQPTYWENCYYRGGDDDGVLPTPVGNVGSVLCWEFIRSRTMRRLRGKIQLVLGGSCWWTLSDDVDAGHPFRAANLHMLQQAPVRCARMLGVPVIHASHAGPFNGFFSPDLADLPYDSVYLGETLIVDANGQLLARREASQGPGIIVSDIVVPQQAAPSLEIPESFWTPPEMPQPWKDSWLRWLESGAYYYDTVTKPYVQTGEVREFIPEYML